MILLTNAHILVIVTLLHIATVAIATFRDVISMPITNVTENDTYLCLATPVTQLRGTTLVGYETDAMSHVTHHVSVALAEDYDSDIPFWSCRTQQGHITKGRVVSLGALRGEEGIDVDHTDMIFQQDIGIQLGKKAKLNYVILQVHYATTSKPNHLIQPTVNLTLLTTNDRRPYSMQKLLLVSSGYIPANSVFSSEIASRWEGGNVTIVSYTLHTHGYGISQEGYLIQNGHATLIGRKKIHLYGTSLLIELETPIEMNYGDVLAARCIYSNTETHPVYFGSKKADEMCNFGVNFKYPAEEESYPVAMSVHQDAQRSQWCHDTVSGTRILCEEMQSHRYNM